MLLGVYNYTVCLTYIGMLAGYAGILVASGGNIRFALFCLMGAGFCDMFDGKVASTKKNRTVKEKRFGIQIDSLSDLICFGVLPAVIVTNCSEGSIVTACISGAYVLCALIRLAWFNVDEEERQNGTTESRKCYLGLPVTTVALILPVFFGLTKMLSWNICIIAPVVLVAMSLAFLTPFQLKKPGIVGKVAILVCGLGALWIVLNGVAR